jgi:hypothetical protein
MMMRRIRGFAIGVTGALCMTTLSLTTIMAEPAGAVVATPIKVKPGTVSDGTVNVGYTETLTAMGGTAPYTFSVSTGTVPAGLALSSGGVLSGTPTTAGVSNFTVQATDASPSHRVGSNSYSLTIFTLNVTPETLPVGLAGSPYLVTLEASGTVTPYSFAVVSGVLPDGLSLASDGTLSGTPTTGGVRKFVVQATDNNDPTRTGQREYKLKIKLGIAPGSLPNAQLGGSYSQALTVIAVEGHASSWAHPRLRRHDLRYTDLAGGDPGLRRAGHRCQRLDRQAGVFHRDRRCREVEPARPDLRRGVWRLRPGHRDAP